MTGAFEDPLATGLSVAGRRLSRWGFPHDDDDLENAVGSMLGDLRLADDAPQITEYFVEALALSSAIRQASGADPLLAEFSVDEVRNFFEKWRKLIFDHFAR